MQVSSVLRKIGPNVGIVLVGVIAAFLVSEMCFRAVGFFGHQQVAVNDRPKFYYKSGGTESFRNYPYEPEKPANTFRIATVGDSFTYPHELQFDDVYPKRLERMLNLGGPGAPAVHTEVINYGMAGLGTAQEVTYVKEALKDHPDMLILQITLNDPAADNLADVRAIENKYKGKYTFGDLEMSPTKNRLLYYSKTLGFIASRLHNSLTKNSYVRYEHDLFSNKQTWRSFRTAVNVIRVLTKQQNVKFVAVIFPLFNFPLDDRYPFCDLHKQLDDYLESNAILHLDLLDAYKDIPRSRLELIQGEDGHPNEIAHRIAAEEIYLFLEKQGVLPKDVQIEGKYIHRYPRAVRYASAS
jgi:lysophospholipase L1-like esterase